jgi:hypothetical protein
VFVCACNERTCCEINRKRENNKINFTTEMAEKVA